MANKNAGKKHSTTKKTSPVISLTYKVLAPVFITLLILLMSLAEGSLLSKATILLLTVAVFILTFERLVGGPLKKVSKSFKSIAKGDFTGKINENYSGELRAISQSINSMVDRFNNLCGTIIQEASLLAASAEEFSQTTKESVKGASDQATKIDEAYQAVQEFNRAIETIVDKSEAAKNGAEEATISADNGRDIIKKTVATMDHTSSAVQNAAAKVNELGESSKQIGNITAVIREITNKTNLLALNAAIEAARAGEHGVGFAVVAEEVRKLAERTSKATKEIENTIQNIQGVTETVVILMEDTTKEVGESASLINTAGEALNEIILKVTNVSDEITTIASSVVDQKKNSNSIVENIEMAASVAQIFTVSAMESSKASEELSQLAAELASVVHNFKVDNRSSQ